MRYPLLVSALLAACGSSSTMSTADAFDNCATETRADTFVVGLDKHGVKGNLDFQLMSGDPAPPAQGNNTWIIQVNSMAAGVVGAPMTGATLTATPFMPDHGHGTPLLVQIAEQPTAGQYKLSPVNLWMPGYWETTVKATIGTTTDSAVFKFCIAD